MFFFLKKKFLLKDEEDLIVYFYFLQTLGYYGPWGWGWVSSSIESICQYGSTKSLIVVPIHITKYNVIILFNVHKLFFLMMF